MSKTKLKFVVIDSNALIHRAFHALPPLTNKEGQITNAVYGFTSILLKALKDLKPDYIAACFDHKEKTFRHLEYEEYKAQRSKSPDELYQQIPLVKQVLTAFNIPIFEKAGFEADDLIGTICHLKSVDRPDIETIIVTGDQDAYQLIDDNTKVLAPHKGMSETILYDEAGIEEKFDGLKPKQLIDYKALRGDPSDNIPGVRGIGEKGAITLLNEFKTLEEIYQNVESDKIKDRIRKALEEDKENAFLSQRLATIIKDVPIEFDLSLCQVGGFDLQKVILLFQELNFKKLLTSVAALNSTKFEIKNGQGDLFAQPQAITTPDQAIQQLQKNEEKYLLVDEKNFESFYDKFSKQKEFCFDTETTGLDTFDSDLIGIGLCWKKNEAYYLTKEIVFKFKKQIESVFADPQVKKIGHNLKFDLEVLTEAGLDVKGIYFDTMIASYVLNPGHRQHGLDNLAFVEFGYQMQSIEELIGKGKNQICLNQVGVDRVCWYCCEDADLSWQLYQKFKPELAKEKLDKLFHDLEMPLIEVLASMEKNGVKIDSEFLKLQSKKITAKINKLNKKICDLAGCEFNISSPQQLKEVLFEKMKLSTKGLGKTKTGLSTAASQLEKLQGLHPIIDLIMEYRELSKLKNTYLDSLPELINKHDDRVHTSFNQTITATGRLSSSNPNLQNIPIRTELGQEIRKAFIAEKGYKLIKADYSQVELRIVASLAKDKEMLEIFQNQGDIHTSTAAFINEVEESEVTKEMRRQAKEVNFGVLYGMGAWGLSQRTGITASRAQEFITKYFQKYQGVKKYIDETLASAEEKGYVETLYGRRRQVPEINSGIQQVRAAAERVAINMPVQGTAADLIKFAMIEIQKKLAGISPKAKMILQVHDELVFEVPEKDIEKVAKFVSETMCSVIKLDAPIETEVKVGDNWQETELLNK